SCAPRTARASAPARGLPAPPAPAPSGSSSQAAPTGSPAHSPGWSACRDRTASTARPPRAEPPPGAASSASADRSAAAPSLLLHPEQRSRLDHVRRRLLIRRLEHERVHEIVLFLHQLGRGETHVADDRRRLHVLHELGQRERVARPPL